MDADRDITRLLAQWKGGRSAALDELVPLVYRELRKLARGYLRRERADHTLQATALVHELFLRLAADGGADWRDRDHFFSIAARAMRQILVSHARQRGAAKRGSGEAAEPYDPVLEPALPEAPGVDLVALDAALGALAAMDPRQARIVELRFFAGYTLAETAGLLACSPATVSREWELARMWLYGQLHGDGEAHGA